MAGTLYVVATPVGNLDDITLRALAVLREVDLIAAEDTRHSRKLLDRYGIRKPLSSYHDHVERERAPRLVERLREGESIALISDAGTPCISDPGYRLVRAAAAAGIRVVPVPGPSAVAAALSASGLPSDRFAFEGFVPARAAARKAFFTRLREEDRTVVCFEAARRLPATLVDLEAILGERELVVARELTKLHEEFLRGSAAAVSRRLSEQPLRGEVTLLVAPRRDGAREGRRGEAEMRASIERLRAEGLGLKLVARTLGGTGGWSAREIYRLGIEIERVNSE